LIFFNYSGDANGLDEPEFLRKLQPSLHFNAQNSNMDLDTNIRKDQSVARPFSDDPFALDGFGDCKCRIFTEQVLKIQKLG